MQGIEHPLREQVATDTCVALNFANVDRVGLLALHPLWRFVLPQPVVEELRQPIPRLRILRAVATGGLEVVAILEPAAYETFGMLCNVMDRGEAAVLVLALHRGWHAATDEGGKTRRMIVERLGGTHRLLTTVDILLGCIRRGVLTVEQADGIKAELEQHRFRMSFASFRDLLVE